MSSTILVPDEPAALKLAAPEDWGGETISLPPGFAPDMKLKGFEHIRFAPGMMKPESDTFFSYAFVFELEPMPISGFGVSCGSRGVTMQCERKAESLGAFCDPRTRLR